MMSTVKLTKYEQEMLDGVYGRCKQLAMENIVKYAKALGATELCVVTKAHCCCGVPPVSFGKADTHEKAFRKAFFCTDEPFELGSISQECFMQSDIGSCEFEDWSCMNHTQERFDENWERMRGDVELGITLMGSCTPYLTGWIPLRGEHFVTSESSNVLMCNSIFGACGNADGMEAVYWSAITGRTPKWGNHILGNRYATTVFNIHFPLNTRTDWDILGFIVGSGLKLNAVPVINPVAGINRPTITKLKQLFATMATSSGAEMCHIVGVTPEAATLEDALGHCPPQDVVEVTGVDYRKTRDHFCAPGSGALQLISLGCPHYTMEEYSWVARALRGRQVAQGVKCIVWTDQTTKEAGRLSGYTQWIERAGAHVLTNGCPVVQGNECYEGVSALAVDAGKQAHYMQSNTDATIYYGTTEQCIEAALTGRWEENQ